jgi:hypothetical protein
MPDVTYSVEPVTGGWVVTQEPIAEPSMFLSGAKAEAAARKLAEAARKAGMSVEVIVHDRAGLRVATKAGLGVVRAEP